jgi:MoaA/NifB/PqqE/SkfB family radical SAM enzyme
MIHDDGAIFLDRIDEIGISLFGEQDRNALEDFLPKYKEQVCLAYEQDRPLAKPAYVLLKVTNRCNSGCAYCNHSIYAQPRLERRDAPAGSFQKVIRQAAQLGVRSINLSGGEPLLRPDLAMLVSCIRELQLVSILLTNGLDLPERWVELGNAGLNYIILSLDSLNPDRYRRQRGASFEQAWRGVEAAMRWRDKFPPAALHVTTVVTRENLAELPTMVGKLAAYGIGVQFSPYHHFDPGAPDSCTPRDRSLVREAMNELISMRESGFPVANSRAYLEHFELFFEQPGALPQWYRCYAAHVGVFVDAELNVRPCWSWSLPIIGNLRQGDLKNIWHSPLFNEQRAKVRKLECSRCWLLCTAELSIRFMNGAE